MKMHLPQDIVSGMKQFYSEYSEYFVLSAAGLNFSIKGEGKKQFYNYINNFD